MSDKFGKNVDKRTTDIGSESNPSDSNDEVSETRDDLEHLKLAKDEESKESKKESAGKGAGSPIRKTSSTEEPPEPKPGTSKQQMQLNPEASVLPEAEVEKLHSRDSEECSEKDLAGTKEDQKSMDYGKMPYKDILDHFLRDEDVHREPTPSEDGDTLSDVPEIYTQTAGSSLEGSVYQDAQSSLKSEPSVSLYQDALESLSADHSDSNSLHGVPSLPSEPTGVTTVSTPTGEQGNDRYRERLEQEARERSDAPSTSSGIGSTNLSELDKVANWIEEGERLPRQSGEYDAPVMRDVVPLPSESASEEQGNERYLEDLNKEARQRNFEGSSDASSVERSDLENIQKWMDEGKRTKSKSSPEKISDVEPPKKNDGFEKHLPAPQSIASSDDLKKQENKHGEKSSLSKTATEVKCSIKDEKPGPRLKVQRATIERIGAIEETVAPLGTEVPLPDTDPTLKESGMSPKQKQVGSAVEPESVSESTETRDTTPRKVSILKSVLSSLKYSDLKETNIHGKAIQSTSIRLMESELKSIYSRATFSETSNIEDEDTDSRISSTLDPMSSTTLKLESGIKSSTECMELEEASKIGGTRKSWQKSGSLRKLQHSTVSSMESIEGGKGDPLGIADPITDVKLAKSPEQMDVSLSNPDSTVPEGDQLHEMQTMQSGPEHGLETKFQSEESGKTPSDIKDGKPDSSISSSSVGPFSTSSDLSHGLGSSIESSEYEGPTILRSGPKSSPKPCSQHKIHYATMTRIETIEEETVAPFETRLDPIVEQRTKNSGMSPEQMEIESPVEQEFAPETADKDETVNKDITEKVQPECGDAAPERSLSESETSSETRRPSVVSKSEEQSSKPKHRHDSLAIATCAPKKWKRSRKKARLDKDKKVRHPASPKKRVRRRSSGSVSESTGELSGSGTNSDSDYSAGN